MSHDISSFDINQLMQQLASISIDDHHIEYFYEQGFIVLRQVIPPALLEQLQQLVEDPSFQINSFGRLDGLGKATKVCVWKDSQFPLLKELSRADGPLALMLRKLMNGPGQLQLHQNRLILKEKYEGGAFLWHQDYHGLVYNVDEHPPLGNVYLPIDAADASNGCLQLIPGSQKLGWVPHSLIGGQVALSLDTISSLLQQHHLASIYVDLQPGDLCFFNARTIHMSAQNTSDKRRYALLWQYILLEEGRTVSWQPQQQNAAGSMAPAPDVTAAVSQTQDGKISPAQPQCEDSRASSPSPSLNLPVAFLQPNIDLIHLDARAVSQPE
eukprot:TRINITY_DN16280_c0_g1_i1.p1 TRINITY_DN16280_c0_g1~~TRINITY_DN16280_c0_g1_i1.p1  ORF type:complete len:326 (-),score=40.18 TRINITY_DN16280_c0_g1_i1:92-1069(-)